MRIARLLFAFSVLALVSCDSQFGDAPVPTSVPNPEGKDLRIRQIANPESPNRAKPGDTVAVSGAVVVAVDTFDETHNGKSQGTIYVADMGSTEGYSGISLFNPSWVPGNLRVGAGDALDLRGTYQENNSVPLQFAPDSFLVQLANPIGTFRFEATLPPAAEVKDIEDLAHYDRGRPYLNMIVTLHDVTVQGDLLEAPANGRMSAKLIPEDPPDARPACEVAGRKAPTIVNELMDLAPLKIAKGTKLKSLTGIVTFFCNLHIAPRTPDDVVIDK